MFVLFLLTADGFDSRGCFRHAGLVAILLAMQEVM